MVESTPFQLSRIYASGWSAGRKCNADDPVEIDAMAGRLNPHQSLNERERWSQGFKDAVVRSIGTPARFRDSLSRTGE